MPTSPDSDPTTRSAIRPLLALLAAMDDELAHLYAETDDPDSAGFRTTWARELIRLHVRGPMTIAELATSFGVSHSATSQKVTAMRAAEFVRTAAGPDARTKTIHLTPKAQRLAPRLVAEWEATEDVMDELDAQLPYSVQKLTSDLTAALAQRPFGERVRERLSRDPRWQ